LSGADALRVELKERSLDHKGKSGELLGRLLAAHGYDVDMSAWSLKVDELKVKLADLGLSRKGTKAELFARLVASSYLPVEKEVRSGKPASCVIKFMYVQTVGAPLHLSSPYPEVEAAFSSNSAEAITALEERVRTLAEAALERAGNAQADEHLSELDWSREAKASVVSEASEDTVCPQWYRSLVKKGELHLSLRTRLAPLLLRCSWTGHPLVHTTKHGWCFRKSQAGGSVVLDDDERLDFDGRDTHLVDDENECAVRYVKVPHPSGSPLKNVGNPLSKDFAKLIDSGVLTAELTTARDRLRDHIACSYWGSSQRRIKEQTVVYQRPGRDLGLPTVEGDRGPLGFIVPNVVPMGTVTRRAVESTWLTAANTKATRIGSEIKSLIRAPPGYAIVGADVDSEELWICSVIGDAQFGFHGATALGWQTLEGTKAAGTDMHSATAKTIGVSRDKAKVFNYSRLYGAGLRFAEQELRKADPQLTAEAARTKASALYAQTKGRQTSYWLERDEKRQKVRAWSGGSESLVFNALETVALSNEPRTLALGASITEALSQARLSQAEDTPDDEAAGRRSQPKLFMTSRINWSVQSSGVDYLHLLIVAIEHVCRHYGIKARYMLSLHDELRYLVKHEDRYRAALAMQVANLWVRAYFAYRLSMDDLPQVRCGAHLSLAN
jgi:DNA polymerase gamma 1